MKHARFIAPRTLSLLRFRFWASNDYTSIAQGMGHGVDIGRSWVHCGQKTKDNRGLPVMASWRMEHERLGRGRRHDLRGQGGILGRQMGRLPNRNSCSKQRAQFLWSHTSNTGREGRRGVLGANPTHNIRALLYRITRNSLGCL
jgi:hypothetical protein